MKNRFATVWGLVLLCLPPALAGKEPKNESKGLDLTQRYLVSECTGFGNCVEKVLNPAGAVGYRFVAGDIWEGYDHEDDTEWCWILVAMEKTGEHNTTYQYIQSPRTQEGLNEAASQGFRLVPRFPVESWVDREGRGGGLALGGRYENLTCLLEKPSNSDLRYQYLVFSLSKFWGGVKASDLFQKMEEAVDKGYEIVKFKKTAHGYAVVLEKPVGADSEPLPNLADASKPVAFPRYRLLSTRWTLSSLRKELAAATGYRLVAADLDALELLLERIPGPNQSYEYVVPTGRLWSTLEKNINEAAAKGFRLHPCSRGFGFVVMEKRSGSTVVYQYQILETVRLSTTRKELAEAVREGFAVVMAIRQEFISGQILVLERPR
jgi:hypothetical protein